MDCPHCGTPVEAGRAHCPHCGARLAGTSAPGGCALPAGCLAVLVVLFGALGVCNAGLFVASLRGPLAGAPGAVSPWPWAFYAVLFFGLAVALVLALRRC